MAKDWIKHIAHTHARLQGVSWCGRNVAMEWAFTNLDHAAYTNLNGDRLVPCARCVRAAVAALTGDPKAIRRWRKPSPTAGQDRVFIGRRPFPSIADALAARKPGEAITYYDDGRGAPFELRGGDAVVLPGGPLPKGGS